MSSDGINQTHGNDAGEPPQAAGTKPASTTDNLSVGVWFWPAAWLGTTLSGGLVGLALGGRDFGPLGLAGGLLLAGSFGFFFQITAAIITWALWLSRFRVAMAAVAGGATGLIATMFAHPPGVHTAMSPALVCAVGGGFGGFVYINWSSRTRPCYHRLGASNRRITKGVILGHLATFVIVALFWTTVVAAIFYLRSTDRKTECSMRLKEIWRVLQSYEAKRGAFLPQYTSDAKGTPLSSWRMRVAAYDRHHDTFASNVDFSLPWNSPKILSHRLFYRCPVSHNPQDSDFTDYVAVVGPGTFWDTKQQLAIAKIADKSNRPRQIVVVEWPCSNIHWAEPRDITVEEFLDWFRSKHERSDTNHPGCLLYVDTQGNVGTLRNNTDPEEVRRLLLGEDTAN